MYSNIYFCTKIFRAWRGEKHSILVVEFNQWVIRGIPRLSLLTCTQMYIQHYKHRTLLQFQHHWLADHLINGYRFLIMCESYVITRRWSTHAFVLGLFI